MATPAGRTRNVGQTRMDAAIDALIPLGFSKGFIRRKVKALLEVYDGEWKFIEDSSYKVLIDAIIDDQDEKCVKKDNEAMEDDNSSSDGDEHFETNNGTDVHIGAEPAAIGTANKMLTSTRIKHTTAKHVKGRDATCVPQAGGKLKQRDKDHESAQDMGTVTTNNKDEQDNVKKGCGENTLQGAVGLPSRRRKPCYGWISSDSSDEENYLSLETVASQRKELNRR